LHGSCEILPGTGHSACTIVQGFAGNVRYKASRRIALYRLHFVHPGLSGGCDYRPAKQMHTIVPSPCTGCDLCLAPYPPTALAWSR